MRRAAGTVGVTLPAAFDGRQRCWRSKVQHPNDERTTRTAEGELHESSESEDDELQDSSNSERLQANSSTAKDLTQVSLTGDL